MYKSPKPPSPYLHFSLAQWVIFFLISSLGFFTTNPHLTVASLLLFSLLAALLWRKGEPPVLFFVVALQWLEVSMKVFHANMLNVPAQQIFTEYFPEPVEAERAIWLGLCGLLILAIGMRLGCARLKAVEAARLREDVINFSLNKIWLGYLVMIFISLVLMALGKAIFPLRQVFQTLTNFRWVMFFILAYTVLYRKKGSALLLIASLFELSVGFTAYFSKFNYVLFVLFLSISAVGYRPKLNNLVKLFLVIAIAVFLSSFWLAIRAPYRTFISLGTEQQIVAVPVSARIEKLFELASGLEGNDLKRGFESLLLRIEYVDFFAYALKSVPAYIPHEEGELWRKAVNHIFVPRIFFPDKPMLPSDSESTMKYTQLFLASGEQGTSISMGYMAESYIDFGIPGMFVPILLLGFLWGFIFRFLVSNTRPRIFGFALSIVVLIDVLAFGSNNIKVLGGVITGLIVMTVVSKFFVPIVHRSLLPSRP